MTETRKRWEAGLCPCCAGEICEWEWNGVIHEPEPIAEGVMLCGRCVGNDHFETVPLILQELVS